MTTIRRSFVPALLAGAAVLPGYATANDLLDRYHDALDQDRSLRAAQYARDAAIEARPQALSAFLPRLNASGSHERSHNEITTSSSRIITDPTNPAPNASSRIDFYNSFDQGQVQLSQTLWSQEAFQRLKQADISVAQAEASFRSAQQSLILRLAQAYFEVLAASDALRTGSAERAATERQWAQAERRREVGLATIIDVQETRAAFDASIATVIAAERRLANAQRALEEITGREADSGQALAEEMPLKPPAPARVEHWLDATRSDNYELRIARLATEIAARNVSAVRARHYPTLSLSATYTESLNSSERNADSTRSGIGLSVSLPIYAGGLIASQVRQASALGLQSKASEESTQRTVERQTRDAFQGVISGIASVRATQAAMRSAQLALESSQLGLKVGTRTEVDVLTALRNLYSAQRSYSQSRYDYLLSVLNLKRQAGRLAANDLADIDALLVPASAEPGSAALAPVPASAPATR